LRCPPYAGTRPGNLCAPARLRPFRSCGRCSSFPIGSRWWSMPRTPGAAPATSGQPLLKARHAA